MTNSIAGQAFLFDSDDGPETEAERPATARPEPMGLRPARATLVATSSPDKADPQGRPLLMLVVDCPFCDHQHIHPGGHVGALRPCLRRSRCVGRPGGVYHFPEVQQ